MSTSSSPQRPELHVGWILAGDVDGVPAHPALRDELGGIPYVMRLVCDLASAGVTEVHVLWRGAGARPDLTQITADPRVASRVNLRIDTAPPDDPQARPVLILRADRIYHRDVPTLAAQAWRSTPSGVGKVAGVDYDAAFAATHAVARALWEASGVAGGLAAGLASLASGGAVTEVPAPYMGFCMPAADPRAVRVAERRLVGSLRKAADGIAAKLLNRRISLPLTRLLAPTSIHPNQVTLIALACALAGGAVISRGGYLAGLVGMLLVELGSIIDGIDGELARLRFQFSRKGQWLDTVVDDLANVAYASGVMVNLAHAGSSWALPVGLGAIVAFVLTQTTQYWLIIKVYGSGDLAAIPWAFQSAEFLSQRPRGVVHWIRATAPKLLKRDFVVTMFTVLAALGHLEIVLAMFAGGSYVFFIVLFTQLLRNRASITSVVRA